MLQKLLDAEGRWVDGPDLANEVVGGSEGLKRLRELRDPEFGGYDIRMRRHPEAERSIFQYRLVGGRELSSVELRNGDTIHLNTTMTETEIVDVQVDHIDRAGQSTLSEQMHEERERPVPEPAEVYEYKQPREPVGESRAHLGKTEDGRYVYVRDEPLPGQIEAFDNVDAGGDKFHKMPTILELGRTVPCPRCRGYRRAVRERDPITNKQLKGGKIIGYEDYSRDPHKPSDTCPRCNGFGVVPS